MSRAKKEAFNWQAEQLSDEQALDFDNFYADLPHEFEIDESLTHDELAQIESDADIFDMRINGYD